MESIRKQNLEVKIGVRGLMKYALKAKALLSRGAIMPRVKNRNGQSNANFNKLSGYVFLVFNIIRVRVTSSLVLNCSEGNII